MDIFKKVTEASYLTVDKAWSYRAILRYFYIQHERMREFLFPEEVYAHLKTLQGFEEYKVEELHQDLDQLVRWNNLIARQETGRARTIDEFKKRRFRYQCTPYTVEFERMLIEMERGGNVFGGSLEKREFERLYHTLKEVNNILETEKLPTSDECFQIWDDLFKQFRSITQNTSDYIAHLNSEEAEEWMQTEAFLVFKDQFTTYLRDFMIGLQQTALQIQQLLQSLSTEKLESFIKKIVDEEQKIPRFKKSNLGKEDLLEDKVEKWRNLVTWFLGNQYHESELSMLEQRTNEQIRRITRIVQRLGERHHYFRSRKKDYLYLANWFASLADLQEAHRLSAVVFGVPHTRHILSDNVPSDDIYLSIWEETPIQYQTNPRVRSYREKTKPGAIINQDRKKEETRKQHLLNQKIEQETLKKYMQGDEIRLAELPIVEPYVRKIFLNWLSRAMIRKDRTFQTENGRLVQVIVSPKERMILRAEDGHFEMPAVTFKFLDEVNM